MMVPIRYTPVSYTHLENVELRIVSERQPVAGAENVESTLEDAYLYLTQIAGGEKNATL